MSAPVSVAREWMTIAVFGTINQTSQAQRRRPPGSPGGSSLLAALAPSGFSGRLFFCPKAVRA